MAKEIKTQKTTAEIGNDIAKEAGYDSAESFINETSSKARTGTASARANAKATALDFTQKLLKLVLYQEIKGEYNLTKYDWINKFDDQRIEAGDAKEYIKNLLTGVDAYNKDAFNPTTATPPSADAKLIRLYKDNGELEKYAFQALKPLTIIESAWFPYFLSGKLMEFIDGQVDLMKKSLFMYKYKVLTNFITDLIGTTDENKISKRIQGTATNIFNCFTDEIFPEIENMQYFNNDFARDATKNTQYPNVNNREDILIIMNRKTYSKFKYGAMSDTRLNNLIGFNEIVPVENIIGTGKNLEIGTSSDNITVGSTELIPENKVLVINKNLLKFLWFVEVSDSQKYVQNMSIQFVQHLWGVFGQLDWEGAFIYENDALSNAGLTPTR